MNPQISILFFQPYIEVVCSAAHTTPLYKCAISPKRYCLALNVYVGIWFVCTAHRLPTHTHGPRTHDHTKPINIIFWNKPSKLPLDFVHFFGQHPRALSFSHGRIIIDICMNVCTRKNPCAALFACLDGILHTQDASSIRNLFVCVCVFNKFDEVAFAKHSIYTRDAPHG